MNCCMIIYIDYATVNFAEPYYYVNNDGSAQAVLALSNPSSIATAITFQVHYNANGELWGTCTVYVIIKFFIVLKFFEFTLMRI